MIELPPGWIRVPLGELVKVVRPRVNPREANGLPFIGMDHVEAQTMRLLSTVPAATMKSAAVQFEPGDVLYGRLRPYLNKVYRPDFRGLGSSEFIALTPSQALDGDYLRYLLNSPDFVRFATSLNTGDRPRVDFKQISDYLVPLPRLDQQRRIVDALEAQMTRLQAGNEDIAAAKSRLQHYRSRVLASAIEGHDDWSVERLGDLLVSLRNGLSHKPQGTDGVRILRISAVRAMAVNLDDVRFLDRGKADDRFLIRDGDLLFTRYNGNPELVGVCGRVEGLRMPTLHPDKVIRGQVDEARAAPQYLEIALNTGMARKHIRRSVKTTAGQAGIAGTDLKAAPVPLPPFAQQQRIADDVHSQLAVAREAERSLAMAARRARGLRHTIITTAITGRLA